jgi:hypothetical protein
MNRPITRQELKEIERYADSIFKALNIDIEFTRHFFDRVNDPRNVKQITTDELIELFKDLRKKYGKSLTQEPDRMEALVNDIRSNINIPFVLVWDKKNNEIDFISKTVMRKKNFKSSNKKFQVGEQKTFLEYLRNE